MRIVLVICGVLIIAGCSGRMVELSETDYLHFIDGTINKEQVRDSILEGAKYAGWEAKDQGNSTILAIYQIRIHTVHVNIYYSDQLYRTSYKTSIAMKMNCSAGEKGKGKYIVSGIENCPGDRPPHYINANYKTWIDSLVAAIEISLAYGEAEEEVNTKSYDKNLWAMALVEAEGDEQQRKARYIELRADQLYSEKVSSISKSKLYKQPTVDTDVSGTNITGTYVSDIRGGWAGILGGNRKLKITFKQSGKDIIGTDVNQKKIVTGTRKEDTIKYKYDGRGSHLFGKWKISSDGTKLEGTWNTSRENGIWNLTKIK